MGGSRTYPYGSTTAMRADTLAVLGVLKVATAGQIQRLTRPAARDNKVARNALLDLARHGLVVSEGSTRTGEKLWGLTVAGLAAAGEVLPDVVELGGIARGAGRSGAPHAMAVNETVIALLQPGAGDNEGQEHGAAPAGLGCGITAVATEVTHHLPAAGRNRTAVRADAVLRAPEAGLPVLLLEVDRGTESPVKVAAKFELYRAFFRLRTKAPGGGDTPVWRTLYPATGREGYPPIALIYTGRPGPKALRNRLATVADLTREHWAGSYQSYGGYSDRDGWIDYADAIPIIATTLPELQEHGPLGVIWHRHGHPGRPQLLAAALANPDDHTAWEARDEIRRLQREEQRRREDEEHRQAAEQRAAQRAAWEAQEEPEPSPPCEQCGNPIHDPSTRDPRTQATEPDATHCPTCRADLAASEPHGLLRTLFSRRDRRTHDADW